MASDRVSGTGRVRVPLAEVLITDELSRRQPRPPDYQAENRALATVADAMAGSPETVLRTLADTILELCRAHSAGISILDAPGPSAMCRWNAVSGRLSGLMGGGIPRDGSVCAAVIDSNSVLLCAYPERHFDYGIAFDTPIVELLVAPFHIDNKPVGTVWVIAHTPERKFDREDQRLLTGLSRFTSAAYQMTGALRAAEAGRADLERRVEERTAAFRAGELRNRRLIDGHIIGVLSMTADGRILEANDAFLDMVGYARDDVAAGRLNWQAITPPEVLVAERDQALRRSTEDGRVMPYEKDFIHRSGARVPALVGGSVLESSSGESICFVLDITERRQRETDEQFLAALDLSLHHIVDLDEIGNTVARALGAHLQARCVLSQAREDGGITAIHSSWSSDGQSLGGTYHMDDFVAPDFQESLHRGDVGVVNNVWTDSRTASHAENFAQAGVAALLTMPWLHEGRWRGNLTLISDEPRVWSDRDSNLLRQVAARVWPRIEHARAVRALRESESRLRLFIDQAPAAIAMMDRDMRYLAASRRWLADYDLVGQELNGRSHYEVFPDLPEGWREIYRRALAGEVLKSEEDWFLRANGVLGWLKWEVRPWHAAGGEIGGIVIFTEDISEQKHAEAALRTLNETLEQRIAERTSESENRAVQLRRLAAEVTEVEQRERRQLASILHDHLQQLLVSARMHMQSVTTRISDADLRQALDKTDLLLDDCITESQSLSHQLSPPILDKLGLLPALVWLADEQHDKHGLSVTMYCDREVEPADPVVRTILFHAVRELLFNIVKHAKVRQAEVSVTSTDQRVRIEVRDSGVGFDPSIATDKSNALGLHSIRERLRLFGGELEVIATPGKGARAILHASLEQTESLDSEERREPMTGVTGKRSVETERPAPSPPEAPSGARRARLLLVDDHPLMRSFLAEKLALHPGIEVAGEAGDGAEAISEALRLRPDVILMDVSMPQLNGIEATRRIIAYLPDVRIIGISLHETDSMARAMIDAGAIDYFSKNEPVDALLEKILRHMRV